MTTEISKTDDALTQEQAALKNAVESGNWEALTAEVFPIFSSKQPKPFYLAKYGMINTEIQSLIADPALPLMDEEARGILRGELKELGAAASETIKILFPNVKPVPQEASPVTPETIETIEVFVGKGAIAQLNEGGIPGWDSLAADQRILYRLRALQNYYGQWEEAEENDSLNKEASLGFDATTNNFLVKAKRAAQIVQDKIIERHLAEWLGEANKLGLTESPIVQDAKKLLKK